MMDRRRTIDVLNRLFQILYRSLPMYLERERAWRPQGQEQLRRALTDLVNDQQHYLERIARLIGLWDGCLESGQFSLDFTSINDVSLEWLWSRVIDRQRRDIALIEQFLEDLGDQPEVRPLVEEILGNARGHLKTLEELR